MTIEAVDAWMAANKQRLRDELFELIRCPSVSTDPAYKEGMDRAASLLMGRFRRPWTTLDAVYFFGYAMTHYASLPFSLRGVKVRALRLRDGGDWHARLDIEYPKGSHTHSQHETLYFDHSGLLVRHDYTPEVSSPIARAANFLLEYQSFDGYMITQRRKVHFRLGRFITPLVVMDASIRVLEVRRVAAGADLRLVA